MTYASMLVAVEEGVESDSRLELACDLAIAFDALLIGLSVGSITAPLYDPITGSAMLGDVLTLYRDMAEADVERARLRFTALTTERAVETEWQGGVGYPAEFCSRAAQGADLLILGGRNRFAPGRAPDISDVLLGCGRPVLVTPPIRVRSPVAKPALVAWKDCREARLALAGAIPLLKRASNVALFRVCQPQEYETAGGEMGRVVRYLARHQIRADPIIALASEQTTGRQILDEAMAREVGLIVAGAYGHTRLREWILGGVTRDLIAESSVSLILAH